MTDQYTPYTPPAGYHPAALKPGDVLWLSCSVCGYRTPHVWGGYPPLACQDKDHAARAEERGKAKKATK